MGDVDYNESVKTSNESAPAEKKPPIVKVSYDQMEASLVLPTLPVGENYSVFEIMDALKAKNVNFGIDQETILSMINNQVYQREIVVARGTKKVDGVDGYFQYNFNIDFNNKPEIREDGSVDYWSVHLVEIVEKGQVIAIYNEPVDGNNGMTVTSKPVPCKRGRPLPPIAGKGFSRSEDGRVYTADITGKIDMKNNRIQISSVYEVYGNVDVSIGTIDFRGDVLIHGNVTTGSKIKATGTITIDGTAEGCILTAGKDIILRGGMIGGERAKIVTKGNLFAKFIEYSEVEAEGYIETDSAMNSYITSYDKIIFTGKFATVVGGVISACGGVEANNIGNDSEKKTEVFVGVHRKLLAQVYNLNKTIKENEDIIERIDAGIQQFDAAAEARGEDNKNDERRVSLFRARIAKQADVATDKDELERLNDIVARSKNAVVRVYSSVYPGVEVGINDARTIVKRKQTSVEYTIRDGLVVMFSIADELA